MLLLTKYIYLFPEILVKNFLQQMEDNGTIQTLSANQIVSRILDDTLPFATFPQVISFLNVFSSNLRFFCVDPFASHVLQTLLTLCLKYIQVRVSLILYKKISNIFYM